MGASAPVRRTAAERFELLEQLGAGGNGTVHRARDTALDLEVAIKILARTEGLDVYRFKREFRAFSGVLHPSLVRLYELFAEDAQWFFSMELVRGVPFDQHVRPPGTPGAPGLLDPARLRDALYQIADALLAIHRLGKVHRDIKPSNILVEASGRVVVLDYGLVTDVRAAAPDQTHQTAAVGTPAYMSPEQALDEPLGPASDWYSLGVLLYEALTGVCPFDGPVHVALRRRVVELPEPPRTHAPGVDGELAALCMALLHRDPAARAGAREVLEVLGRSPSAATLAVDQGAAAQPFVGRRDELAILRGAFDEARGGGTACVLVTGPSGIGKTTLIQGFLDSLGDEVALVLRGRCYERETVPFQAIDGLVDALTGALLQKPAERLDALLPPDLAVLARQFPALDRVPAIARARALLPRDPSEQRRRALRAFAELVWRLAGRRTPVFFVDDLQWSDDDSTGALADVLRQLAAVGVLFVASCRSVPEALVERPGPPTSSPGRLPGRSIELPVAAMPADDAAALASAVLGDPRLARRFADAIAEESNGEPGFLVELARATGGGVAAANPGRDDRSGAATPRMASRSLGPSRGDLSDPARSISALAPVTLEELLDERIRALPAPTRVLLQVCAVAARPLALDLAAAASGCEDPAAALSRLRVERLIRVAPHGAELWIEPYHDRVRGAVVAPLSPGDVRGLHAWLAAALDGRAGTTAAQLVVHRLAAGEISHARALARTAAADAEAAFAFHRAADLYRMALETGGLAPAERRALARRHAECLLNTGRLAEAIEVLTAAAAGAEGAERRELKRLEIECRLRCGDYVHGVAEARALLAEVGVGIPAGRAAIIAAMVAQQLRGRLRGRRFTRRAATAIPAEVLERIDVLWALTVGLVYVIPPMGRLAQLHHLRAALDAGEPMRVARALCFELPRLATDRGEAQLAPAIAQVRGLIAEVDVPELTATLEACQCYTVHLLGRWRASAEHAIRAEPLVRDHIPQRWMLSVIQIHRVAASWYLGETRSIVELMPRYLAEAEALGDAHTLELLRVARGNVYWLILGRPEEARAMATTGARRDGVDDFHVHDYLHLQAHVQIDLYEGAGRAAHERVDRVWPAFQRSLLRRYRPLRIESLFLRARSALAAAAGGGSDRARLVEIARRTARSLAAESLPWAHVIAASIRAGAAHQDGERDLPALLEAVEAAAAAADMHLLAHAARYRRGEWCGGGGADEVADAMRREQIADPAAVVRLLLPG
jgi:eukaryotic-like serine/threonine-protein kinase